MSDILVLSGVNTFINQFHILEGVDLNIRQGAATVILGRNGAGKTTTLETIMGLRKASSGTIRFDGTDITRMPDYKIPRLGISYVPEDREIFSTLSVENNLKIACRNEKMYDERLETVFGLFPDMKKYFKKRAGVLSGGQAQMLSIARALINENKLILIDEPSKGLAPLIIRDIVGAINEIKMTTSILLVEQNYEMATSIGDYYYIVEEGRTVYHCTREEFIANEEVKSKYLGIA